MNSTRYCGPSPAARKYYSRVNPARQSIPRGSWSIDGKVLLQKYTDTVREAACLIVVQLSGGSRQGRTMLLATPHGDMYGTG